MIVRTIRIPNFPEPVLTHPAQDMLDKILQCEPLLVVFNGTLCNGNMIIMKNCAPTKITIGKPA